MQLIIILMLLSKYKYSLNRGLEMATECKKKGINVKTYSIISQNTPVLYDISINPQRNTFILYNDHEYLHRHSTLVSDSDAEDFVQSIKPLYLSSRNNLTVFIANQPSKSDQIIMASHNSLLRQTYQNMLAYKKPNSRIELSIVGIRSENILTDELYRQTESISCLDDLEGRRPLLRVKNCEDLLNKYELENVTKKTLVDEGKLLEFLVEYREIKNQNEYMSLTDEKYWDWLQGEIFILTQVAENQSGNQAVLKFHYLLKVNQYLQTTAPLMLKLGITLRKLQERSRVETSETKLFKFLSNCWNGQGQLENIHLFLQIGHHLALKQEYLCLVPTSEVITKQDINRNFQNISFVYIKNYENYPKITSFISKLNKQGEKQVKQLQDNYQKNRDYFEEVKMLPSKPYARPTFSSIQKKRANNIQKAVEQSAQQQNRNLEDIIQEAANLYKESNIQTFRLSYFKKSNIDALKRHKKLIETIGEVEKPTSQFYRSQRMKCKSKRQHTLKTPNQSNRHRLSSHSNAFQIYTKGKRINRMKQIPRRQAKTRQLVESMVKRQILQLEKGDQIIFFDDESSKQVY